MITTRTIKRVHSAEGAMARHYLILYACVIGLEAKRVFEFGGGYSSHIMLDALEETGGKLITCDPQSAKKLWLEPRPHWTHLRMLSNKGLGTLKPDDMFEMVFHDGTHHWEDVKKDIKRILPHVKRNGLILIHDTANKEKRYKLYKALKIFVEEKVTLAFGYGLTIIRQTKGDIAVELKWTKDR